MKQNLKDKNTFKTQGFLFVLIVLSGFCLLQAQTTVTGNVSDEVGPLSGASVVVKGTTTGAVADFDGNYSIEVSDGENILIFSYVGYSAQEIAIDGRTSIDVELSEDAEALSEVVVVGYGTQRKADLTGAVASLGAAEIVKQPIVSPDQVLAGTISGVNITNRSGDPGAPISVNIRGVGTLSADANPLYVVDGIPLVGTNNITVNTSSTTDSNPLASINPSDIESIDFLKDAASAAIYGSRGANGVIIITTKKGTRGDPVVTYDGYTSLASARETIDVLNVEQYIGVQNELDRDFSAFNGQPFVDWQDAIFRDGLVQNHNIGVSGGGKNGTYYVSGSYLDNEGIQRAQNFTRYSLRANAEFKIGKRLKFGESLQISQSDRLTQSEGAINAGYNAALIAPFFPIFGDGPLGYTVPNPDSRGAANGFNNLIQLTDERINRTTIQNRKVLGHFFGEWEIIDGLKLRPSIGIDYNVGSGDFFQAETIINNDQLRQSLLVQSRPIELTVTTGTTLSYDKTFGDHNFGALVGFEQTKFRFDKVRLQGRNLFNDNFAASGTTVAGANEADLFTLQGFIGRLTYNYKGKYLATVNVRRDATSKFAEDFRSGVFPSISVGWRISQEDFFNVEAFDDLKLRIGYGELGNQNLGDGTANTFPFLTTLNNNIFYVLGEGQGTVVGPAPTTFANQSIGWETSRQIDIGLDFSLFKGKITGVFDYFKKTNEDALVQLPLPFASGFFLPAPTNAGKITNSGIELALNYKNKIGDNFEYGIGANLTTVKNTVQSLGQVEQIIAGVGGAQSHRTIVGQSLGHFFGYRTNGLYQNDAEVAAAVPDLNGTPAPGDIRFVDINNDGVVDANDRTFLGSPYPGYFYGVNLQAKYKNFDFSMLFRGVGDRQIYNSSRIALEGLVGTNNFSTQVLNRWTGEGSTNSSLNPRLAANDPNQNNRISDRFIEDADYLRIQNVQLGYSLPDDQLQRWTKGFISNMRFYVSAQNLATFTNYSGFDPEVGRAQSFQKGNNPLATGQDDGQAPLPQIFQLGWSVSFK